MTTAAQHHLRVNLVRNHNHSPFVAYPGKALKAFFRVADAARIVRIAQHQHFSPFIYKGLQAVKIHFVCFQGPVLIIYRYQRIVDNLKPAGLSHDSERVIYRRLDYHFVSFRKKTSLRKSDSFYNAGDVAYIFRRHLPSMKMLHP